MKTLAIIVKNEAEKLNRIIESYINYFDQIVIAYDDDIIKEKVLHLDEVALYKYNWRNDFAHKRNFLEDKVESEYYFRIDVDDKIINLESIDKLFNLAKTKDVVYCWYVYSTDEWGNTNAGHYRETVIRKSPDHYWNKPVHENIVPNIGKDLRRHIDTDHTVVIKHDKSPDELRKSAERNIKSLIKEYERDGDKTDPRTLAYLGRMLFSVGLYDKSLFFLEKHIENSGWDEDRYMSWCTIAETFKHKKDYSKAIGAAFEGLQERPDYPDAYLKLHDIYFDQNQWNKAIQWGEIGLGKPTPTTFMILDPSAYTWRPAISLAFCYLQKGKSEKAYKLYKYAEKKVPTLNFIKQNKKIFERAFYDKKLIDHIFWMLQYYKDNDKEKISQFLKILPDTIEENPDIIKLRHKFIEPKKWSNNSLVILCGNTAEYWSPSSVKEGIGGSESAVIYMAKELKNLGYDVTVFNKCKREKVYDGVPYKKWTKFNPKDDFNILISWRTNIFLSDINAKKKIIWLHDYPQPYLFPTEDCHKFFDKVIVLSGYHKSLLPDYIPGDKTYVSTNGLNPDDFKDLNEIRDPKRIIYTSSYDRGLVKILKGWDKIRKSHPKAELYCFYGWDSYDKFMQRGYRTPEDKKEITDLMKKDGVYECGRVGHKQLLKEYAKSGVYAYPTNFAGEINCIALTKAIACGCNVVTNDKYALRERSPNAVSDENFINELINTLSETPKDIDKKYIKENSWGRIADNWQANLLNPQT